MKICSWQGWFELLLQLWDCSKGLKNEFETAVVNEPLVPEPRKFYCICSIAHQELHYACYLNQQISLNIYLYTSAKYVMVI